MSAMQNKLSKKIVDSVIKRLCEIRKERGYSHDTVAKKAGLHRSTISLIETRKREATLLTLIKISHALECDLGTVILKVERELPNAK
jgi:transcriptional regulator with XRE-family HTH domain